MMEAKKKKKMKKYHVKRRVDTIVLSVDSADTRVLRNKRVREEVERVSEKKKRNTTIVEAEEEVPMLSIKSVYPDHRIVRDVTKISSKKDDSYIHRLLDDLSLEDKVVEKSEQKEADAPKIDIPSSAKLVLIVGPSGVGKSRYMNSIKYCHTNAAWICIRGESSSSSYSYLWPRDRAIVSCFDQDRDAARKWLSSVGLNSIPDWCKPYHVLSTGQKYRASLAHKMWKHFNKNSKDTLRLDNFATHLDEIIAKSCAHAVSKQIRRIAREHRVIICTYYLRISICSQTRIPQLEYRYVSQ